MAVPNVSIIQRFNHSIPLSLSLSLSLNAHDVHTYLSKNWKDLQRVVQMSDLVVREIQNQQGMPRLDYDPWRGGGGGGGGGGIIKFVKILQYMHRKTLNEKFSQTYVFSEKKSLKRGEEGEKIIKCVKITHV